LAGIERQKLTLCHPIRLLVKQAKTVLLDIKGNPISKFLTNAAVIEFDSLVKHNYQAYGKLRNTVTLRTGVRGESYKFTRMGQGLANQKASQADVTPMDISHARQTASMENWNAGDYTDIFDQAEVNFDEKAELAKTIAKALGRREDQIIINAMNGGTYSATPGDDPDTGYLVADGGANLTEAKLREAALSGLTDRNVDDMDRTLAVTAAGVQSLMGEEKVTSSDFVTLKALIGGTMDQATFMGFRVCLLGSRLEGGLPQTGNIVSAFGYHKEAIGYAVGLDMQTRVDWIAQKTSWLANGVMKSGAVIRENAGIVKIEYDVTA